MILIEDIILCTVRIWSDFIVGAPAMQGELIDLLIAGKHRANGMTGKFRMSYHERRIWTPRDGKTSHVRSVSAPNCTVEVAPKSTA